jgi:hypothetical protein
MFLWTRFRIHRPSVENALVLIVASVKYNRRSEKNIEHCFFHINLRLRAWTSCNKGVMQKLKRHGNVGSCFKKHEKLKIKIFAERVMENHIYSSIDFYISISKKMKKVKIRVFLLRQKIITLSTTTFVLPTKMWHDPSDRKKFYCMFNYRKCFFEILI